MSKAKSYGCRAAMGIFLISFFNTVLDSSPYSPLGDSSGALRIGGAAFLASLLAVTAGTIAAVIGWLMDRR